MTLPSADMRYATIDGRLAASESSDRQNLLLHIRLRAR
jgi:hypothetical protein